MLKFKKSGISAQIYQQQYRIARNYCKCHCTGGNILYEANFVVKIGMNKITYFFYRRVKAFHRKDQAEGKDLKHPFSERNPQ